MLEISHARAGIWIRVPSTQKAKGRREREERQRGKMREPVTLQSSNPLPPTLPQRARAALVEKWEVMAQGGLKGRRKGGALCIGVSVMSRPPGPMVLRRTQGHPSNRSSQPQGQSTGWTACRWLY